MSLEKAGQDVAAEIRFLVLLGLVQSDQSTRVEQVVAHRGIGPGGVCRQRARMLRLLLEGADLVLLVDLDNLRF
jgi:hypothetical protein